MNVTNQVVTDSYAIYCGDSCELIRAVPDNSVHFGIHSPPFEGSTNSRTATATSATTSTASSGSTTRS